ncbi:MAG: class I SAM-dependent methyltransferase [Acidobacteriaceae bacterium]|nr:class I SAM-dependent methyltransferase [Acidobacteriaceae bacterium]
MTDAIARNRFLREYQYVRRAEGRGSEDSSYYLALPFKDLSGRNTGMWKMRAKTYRYFERHILKPVERRTGRPLEILDLGAGNCWLSYRLSLRGHHTIAVDIFNDELDGLGAAQHYGATFSTVEADFDDLPLSSASFDMVIYNSSVHYSTNYAYTLLEARRCLRPGGQIVILDSPLYKRKEDGLRMVQERHAFFKQHYGFRSDAIPSIEFLDVPTLRELSATLKLTWHVVVPWYGWRWHTRGLGAWMQNKRPPSRFWILVGTFNQP